MKAAGHILEPLYPNIFHVTCAAHLLHNCAMKVRNKYCAVDELIAAIKMLCIKNKTRSALLFSIGQLPTGWWSWIKAAIFYAINLQ